MEKYEKCEKMKKCMNQCENRALNLIISANEFSGDSGASEKHFFFVNFWSTFFEFLTGS